MRELADNLRFMQELLFQVLAESINEGLEGHSAADDVVASFIDPARSSRTRSTPELGSGLLAV